MNDIKTLLAKFSIEVKDISLYELALTHPSYNSDARTKDCDYERLEFIGDSVLGFISADMIYRQFPTMHPGEMSKLRSYHVKRDALARHATEIDLVSYIKVGHSISNEQMQNSKKILEDIFEAFIGAIYLDNDIEVAYKFVKSILYEDIVKTDISVVTDPKSKLQEMMQAEYRDSVHYTLIEQSGPAHDRSFIVSVMFNDIVLATGKGKSKKAAEEDAAKNALEKRSI